MTIGWFRVGNRLCEGLPSHDPVDEWISVWKGRMQNCFKEERKMEENAELFSAIMGLKETDLFFGA